MSETGEGAQQEPKTDLISDEEMSRYKAGFEAWKRAINLTPDVDEKRLLQFPIIGASFIGLNNIGGGSIDDLSIMYRALKKSGISGEYSFCRLESNDPSRLPDFEWFRTEYAVRILRENGYTVPAEKDTQTAIIDLFNSASPSEESRMYGLISSYPADCIDTSIRAPQATKMHPLNPEQLANIENRRFPDKMRDSMRNHTPRPYMDSFEASVEPLPDGGNFVHGMGVSFRTPAQLPPGAMRFMERMTELDTKLGASDYLKTVTAPAPPATPAPAQG